MYDWHTLAWQVAAVPVPERRPSITSESASSVDSGALSHSSFASAKSTGSMESTTGQLLKMAGLVGCRISTCVCMCAPHRIPICVVGFVPFGNGVALAFTQESLGNQIVADLATQRLHAENGERLLLRIACRIVCTAAGALGVQREKDKAHQRLMERRKVCVLQVSLTSRNHQPNTCRTGARSVLSRATLRPKLRWRPPTRERSASVQPLSTQGGRRASSNQPRVRAR